MAVNVSPVVSLSFLSVILTVPYGSVSVPAVKWHVLVPIFGLFLAVESHSIRFNTTMFFFRVTRGPGGRHMRCSVFFVFFLGGPVPGLGFLDGLRSLLV